MTPRRKRMVTVVAILAGVGIATLTADAQPLAFAFGGEAQPTDYARAIADATLLALIANLGLLQLGHETTPELVQLAACTLFLYALAVSPFRRLKSRLAMLAALPVLAASGAVEPSRAGRTTPAGTGPPRSAWV